MLLKKIKLKNFRQYYGDVSLTFNVSNNKNITVIHGENGVGKTALLNAIHWAFYEKLTSNFRNPANLVNNEAKRKGKTSCSVEIHFEEDNRDYVLLRGFDQTNKKSTLKVFEMKDSVLGPAMDEPQMVINSILPQEMADYFFFQGEGSNAVDTGNNQGNLRQSIRNILGFRVAETLLESFNSSTTKIRREISKQDNSGESSLLDQLITKDESALKIVEATQKAANIKIPELAKQLDDTNDELARINNQDLNRLRKKESEVDRKLRLLKSKKIKLEREKYQKIGRFGWSVFGAEFANSSLDFIDEPQLKGKIPEPYNKTLIQDLLEKAECICGRHLKKGSEEYNLIISLLDKAANPKLIQRLSGIRAQIQSIEILNSLAKDSITTTITQYDDLDEEIQELTNKLKSLDEQIKGIPEEKIRTLQTKKNNLNKDYKEQIVIETGAIARAGRLAISIKDNTNKQRAFTSNSSVVLALEEKRAFIEELQNFLLEYLAKVEKNIRSHVLTEVNNTLDKFSRHDFKIKVSEDFRFYLKDKNDDDVGQSDGQNLLLNLTITAALISFTGKQKNITDPILNSATVAPLVIDAPFGDLDNKYRSVIIRELPKHVDQIIFLVSSSQWTPDMDKEIRHLINSEFYMVSEESSPQGSKELDRVMINGKEIITSRYGCDVDRTVIEEL